MASLGVTFAAVPDPRAGNARHDLVDVLVIAFAAVLCGAETCCDMALFGRAKEPLLREMLRLTDAQFAKIVPHLPTDTRGKPRVDDRRVISGIVHVLKSGGR